MKKSILCLLLAAAMLLPMSAQARADEELPADPPEAYAEPEPAASEEPSSEPAIEPMEEDLPDEDGSYQDTERAIVSRIITDGMSDYEKLVAITKYAADNYSYSTNYSASALINYGSGSCVANTYFILDLCELAGIQAWYRSANRDPGAASQHVNAIAKIGDTYYAADSGYGGTKPRSFDVTEHPGGFSVKDGVLYQYDGRGVADVVVPAQTSPALVQTRSRSYTKDSMTITQIGYSDRECFSYGSGIKSITLPATVRSVTGMAFKGCSQLENIYVDAANPYFSSIDGVLYNKELTRLICVPAKKTSIIAPNTVTSQDANAFYGGRIPVTYASVTTPFKDVKNEWFADSVRFVYNRGLFMGTTDTTFSPDAGMTRGMFITVLGRFAGNGNWAALDEWSGTLGVSNAGQVAVRSGTTTSSSVLARIGSAGELIKVLSTVQTGDDGAVWYQVEYGSARGYIRRNSTGADGKTLLYVYTGRFTDLPDGRYYTGHAQWANMFGVMYGVSDTAFLPEQNIKREDICALLYRYLTEYLGKELPTASDPFTDDGEISRYARDAVYAMRQIGVVSGYPDGSFRPGSFATRAEVAVMFQNLYNYVN